MIFKLQNKTRLLKDRPYKLLLLTLILLLTVLLGWNGVLELRAEEPRRAIVSIEMWLSGEYMVPKINQWSYYNKPPLFNWVMLLFFKLFNSCEEWVVRLPSLLAFITTAVLNFYIVKQFLRREVALLSSLFLLTCADLLFYGTVNAGEIDLFFSLLVFGQAMAVFVFFDKKQFLFLFLISYLFAALGTLTKGLPSIAFQALTLLPWLILNSQWRLLFSWKHFLGIALYVLIVGGYFYAYDHYDDGLGYMTHLFKEASQRTGVEHSFLDVLKQSATFPFYLVQLMLPWSLFVIFFFRKDFFKIIKPNKILHFCSVFLLFNIPLYWFSADHRARYLYPFFPFICILLSYFFINVPTHLQKWKKRIEGLFLVIMVIGAISFPALIFIPQTAEIEAIIWKCLFLLSAGGGLIFLYFKFPEWKLNFFILFLLVLRLGFNLTYLPATAKYSNSMIYKEHINQVLAITGKEPVHWAGQSYSFEADASIGPMTMGKVTLTSAPLLAYQIPYYITKGNKHIMKYDRTLQSKRYYLAHESFFKKGKNKALYRFPDNWMRQEVVLFLSE